MAPRAYWKGYLKLSLVSCSVSLFPAASTAERIRFHTLNREEIDERYLDTPYYLAPNDKVAQEAFAVIRDAMREKKMAGLARIVLYRRERVLVLEPFEEG